MDPEKETAAVAVALQIVWLVIALTVGKGFTVIVNEVDAPEHVTPLLVMEGVMVIVAVTGTVPMLCAGNDRISPVPLAASPIETSELTQVYCAVGTDPVK